MFNPRSAPQNVVWKKESGDNPPLAPPNPPLAPPRRGGGDRRQNFRRKS
ncbi:MAG: hypothetical protein F6K48_10085 [Okeania sp. SIO3H1]|nr:hypothetical protein [Okeania sp. SIO1I7]NEN89229.1 hypothetical protein [Okeania sp. SIO3H1]NET29658.1 hypothetical protein [Okeania sp. SIO1I7]